MNAAHTPIQLRVPSYFWNDHADRCPCDNAETDMATEICVAGSRTLIEATPEQLEVLRSDAAYYCDRSGPDEAPASLKRSAKATLAAIAKVKGAAA